MPTFYRKADRVAASLAFGVGGNALVKATFGLGDLLQHQALVADDDTFLNAIRQLLTLKKAAKQNYKLVTGTTCRCLPHLRNAEIISKCTLMAEGRFPSLEIIHELSRVFCN